MTWLLIIQLVTGKHLALDTVSEAQCRDYLAKVNAGIYVTVILDDKSEHVIARAITCETEAEFLAKRGKAA